MGPQQGQATSFNWKWYYSAAGLLIWMVLITAILLPRTNRDLRILLIFVPIVVVNLLWWFFMKLANMNSMDAAQFGVIFDSATVGVAVLWLLANWLARFGGAVRFFLSFGTVVIVGGLGTFCEFSKDMALFLALFVLMALTMLVAMTSSRKLSGGKYRPVCFMLWLALWTLLISLVATSGFIGVGSIIMSSGPSSSIGFLVTFFLAGLVFGLFLYVLNLPFMLLGFSHPFFRERFCACLGIRSVPSESRTETGSQP